MASFLNKQPTKTIQISPSERLQQSYVIGSTGVGKSTLLLNMILHDITTDHGVCVLDPHGDLITDIIARMDSRVNDVVLLSLTNPSLPFGLNIFHCQNPHDPISVQMTVSTVINVFEKVFGLARATMGRQLTYLRALIYLFIHNPELTALDVSTILNADTKYDMLRRRLGNGFMKSRCGEQHNLNIWSGGIPPKQKTNFIYYRSSYKLFSKTLNNTESTAKHQLYKISNVSYIVVALTKRISG